MVIESVCGSVQYPRPAEITVRLSTHPAPPIESEIAARVDDLLAGRHDVYGDPRPREARREELVWVAEGMAGPSREPLGERVWAFEWLETPNARLEGRRPNELLDTAGDLERLMELLRAGVAGMRNAQDAD
jgi:hypothetical protein